MTNDDPVARAIEAARYADAIMARMATISEWKSEWQPGLDYSWSAPTETGHLLRVCSPEYVAGSGRELADAAANGGVSDMGWSWQIHHRDDPALKNEWTPPGKLDRSTLNAQAMGGKVYAPDHGTDPAVYSGEHLPTREHAEQQLEQAYAELARKPRDHPKQPGFDYDSFFKGDGPGEDDFRGILGMMRRTASGDDYADPYSHDEGWYGPDDRMTEQGHESWKRKFDVCPHCGGIGGIHAHSCQSEQETKAADWNPDEDPDPFDPRLLGASRTAAVYDWNPYTPSLVRRMQDEGVWDGSEVDQQSWETRSDAGDHYYVRPAGSVVNTLNHDHPMKHTGDPERWEVDHLPPEYGHDPEGYFGDIHGPTALNRWAHPVEGVHPHGFSSAQEAMDWVHARHPEEGFDPDGQQDPFDPRLIGASLRLAANEDLLSQLHDEFHGWYAEHGNEKLNWAGRGPLGNWHQIENFLKDRYPEAHKGITTGKEEAGSLLDTGQLGPDGDYCPKCHGRGFHLLRTNEACPSCNGSGKPDQPMAYATGPDAVDRHGYDPKEIAAGMLLLHNRTHSERSDLEQGDNDRLSEIARMRSQMQREGRLDYADIIRLAGDGMSWEDTMAHIDSVLAEGETVRPHEVMNEDYLDGPHPGTLPRPGGHDRDEIDYNDENGFDAAGFDPDDNVFSDEDDDWDSLGPEGRHDRAYSRHITYPLKGTPAQ